MTMNTENVDCETGKEAQDGFCSMLHSHLESVAVAAACTAVAAACLISPIYSPDDCSR
eukprot:CAMPEP_0202913460 /NCGR_PEP_ID=MMETSP1392-20130828/60529_1 /ASSEMBLY_ACC=CAM_ASM_000868 /TAXON_ID=225041 /ORGANISM="Chlamydomonas chlamydogama, Strain SAG 11-48b" /LENGTH=57 /DNA_ID=CAMNT_0049604729 /DNA_START=1083 /DNA_END=1256 /DNA_ORIENTATION=+